MFHGLPWLIPLLPNLEVSRRFLPSLRRDSLLTDDQVRRIEKLSTERPMRLMRLKEQPIVCAFGQPFRLNVADWKAAELETRRKFQCSTWFSK